MQFISNFYHVLRSLITSITAAADFRLARQSMLADGTLSTNETNILKRVSLQVHRSDEMYVPFNAKHYLSVGLSAIRCIDAALAQSGRVHSVQSILDFPCGFGRVLRFLKTKYPNAEITVAEIDKIALDYCRRIFFVETVASDKKLSELSLSRKFDLIWCGSLITHLNAAAARDLLKLFYNHLAPGGLCIFSSHGKYSINCIENNMKSYGLSKKARNSLVSQFHRDGYGYADYDSLREYGISAASHEYMKQIASEAGGWTEIYFRERGWDNHHDVYGYIMA